MASTACSVVGRYGTSSERLGWAVWAAADDAKKRTARRQLEATRRFEVRMSRSFRARASATGTPRAVARRARVSMNTSNSGRYISRLQLPIHLRKEAAPARPAHQLPCWFELGVHLPGEPLCDKLVGVADLGVRLGDLGVEISPGLRRDYVGLALAILDHFRYAIPNPEHHVAVRDHTGPAHSGAVTRNDFRVRPRTRDDLPESLDHPFQPAPIATSDIASLDL